MNDAAGVVDPIESFFERIADAGGQPLLRKARGVVRFEIVDGKRVDRRLAVIDKGAITVSRRARASDGVIRAERALFERLCRGEVNPIAALLRGELRVEGDWRLLVLVQRLFPSPPRRRTSRREAGYARRRQ